MAKQQTVAAITALPPSPDDDRRSRMVKYLIAMSIRVVCILLCFFVQGWWLAVFAVGAIVLPYLAVVLANVGGETGGIPMRPGSVELVRQRPIVPPADAGASDGASTDGQVSDDPETSDPVSDDARSDDLPSGHRHSTGPAEQRPASS